MDNTIENVLILYWPKADIQIWLQLVLNNTWTGQVDKQMCVTLKTKQVSTGFKRTVSGLILVNTKFC